MDKVEHFEIPADDLARARAFYETCFGWRTTDFPMPDGSVYVGLHTGPTDSANMVQEKGFINGGMFQRGGAFAPTGPIITMVVQDIEATLEMIKSAGGEVVAEPKEIPDMGRYAYARDTEGNMIGVWQSFRKAEEI